VGEFGIGTNREMTFFTNDILYDEKILGTIHIALGRSYTQCGGVNQSSLHWDIVKDLRHEGTVYIDGEPAFQGGAWTALSHQ
jgi:aminopeptidase